MSKFGLNLDDETDPESIQGLADRLAAFPLAAPRHRLDLAAVDEAAAAHGFISREAAKADTPVQGRRRRLGSPEPTRHLAIRLTMKQYEHFVTYADAHQLTYQDALMKLLEDNPKGPE